MTNLDPKKIKQVHYDRFARGKIVMIEATDYGHRVHQWSPDGVTPPSEYDTPHEAIARAAQLLKVTEPITPQSWPEIVQIGSIE